MSGSDKKNKSLFGFFHKGSPSSLTAAEMLNAARVKAEAEAAASEAEMPVKVTQAPAPYRYIPSWQKTPDMDEQEREVVVNASGVASRLQEILAAPDMEPDKENAEPRCLSAMAGEKFRQALMPAAEASPTPEAASVPASPASPRFSERLKRHVEGSLTPALTPSFSGKTEP